MSSTGSATAVGAAALRLGEHRRSDAVHECATLVRLALRRGLALPGAKEQLVQAIERHVGPGRRAVFVCLLLLAFAPAATAATPTITEFSAGITPGSAPISIAAGPDGNLWFSNKTAHGPGNDHPSGRGDWSDGITAGPDGNLWFTTR